MPRQLPTDCLNEIFEILEDKATLHSCLLVNRLWSEVSVRILWRKIWNYNTLIDCLPKESKETLCNNEIITKPSLKPPLFNYVSFLRRLSIDEIVRKISSILRNHHPFASESLIDIKFAIIIQEIFKMFMSRISLKILVIRSSNISNITFSFYPGAIDCLKNLSAFGCCSDICSEFFYQLSQICRNVQSLSFTLKSVISNGLTELISVQQNLKSIKIYQSYLCKSLKRIIPFLAKHSNTLTKVNINGVYDESLLFLVNLENLQELILYHYNDCYEDFKMLQHVVFPHLRILRLKHQSINPVYLIKFLENNGNTLEKFRFINNNNSINLAVGKFCSNLKLLCTNFMRNEAETLIGVLSNCHRLEGIEVLCGDSYLNEIELFKIVAKYSPKPFYKLTLHLYKTHSKLLTKELESFFTSWKDRTPQKPLNFTINAAQAVNNLDFKKQNMKVIEKFIKLGVIKNFTMSD
ncbi:17277_t:CDS:1 [Funneliformis caledonium]|uniref:17277_t:CDS:1 n=1 Tax=Funneliformis caledonium TaxID=1117310 RepID=A0A9N9E840_9GLOM|nr:17277_t:CDS:1 [Funneliformis caledonium]